MTTIPLGFGIAKVRFQIVGGVQECITTFGYTSIAGAEDPTADATVIDGKLTAAGKVFNQSNVSTQYQYKGVDCVRETATGPLNGSFSHVFTGTGTGAPLTSNCSFLIKKLSATGGRKGRGRLFVPPVNLPESNINANGTIEAVTFASISAPWATVVGDLAAGGITMVIIHSDGSTPSQVTALVPQLLIATQRRRMRH